MKFDYVLNSIEDQLNTPEYGEMGSYEDADDDLRPVAQFLKEKSMHNEDIEPDRIKFLYTTKAKKDGGRYVIGSLVLRSDVERFVDDRYDFIAFVYYPVWKDLDADNKVIQLDKILSGIDMGTTEKPKIGKKQPDIKEHLGNLNFFGAERVLDSSEIVSLACERYIEEQKEQK